MRAFHARGHMRYTTAELVILVQEGRTLLHETLMGLPMTSERHDRLLDLHDRTRDFEVTDNTALEVKPGKRSRSAEKATTGVAHKAVRVMTGHQASEYPEAPMSIDAEVAAMRASGDTRSRDTLREVVKAKRQK